MAENKDGQEKSEEPTSKKIEKSREDGQLPRSRELNTFLIMVIAAAAFIMMGGQIVDDLSQVMISGFVLEREQIFDSNFMVNLFQDLVLEGMWSIAGFALILTVVGILSSISLGGWNFSTKALVPKFNRLNPFSGIKRIFGPKGLLELVKALAKFAIIAAVAIGLLWWKMPAIMAIGYQSVDVALVETGEQVVYFFLMLCCTLVIVALVDVPFQLWDNKRQLKMTMQEVKDENKQTEGSPEVKARIRMVQREMAQRRMMQEVPTADVIITNPTHFAVALKYDQKNMRAPILVAKGSDILAGRIRAVAFDHHVPILSSPALARAVYYHTELGEEIPEGLYTAVAKVLAYIFQLKKGSAINPSAPLTMDDVEIPEDLRKDA